MLVHPEPGTGIFPDNRLELVPASLRHFLERSARGKFNPGDEKPLGNARRAAARNGR